MKKIAIVTGGSRGIGLGISKQLGLDGYQLVIMAVSPEEKNKVNLAEVKTLGISYIYVQGDVSQAEDRRKCVDQAVATYGSIDVLVNNAGVAPIQRADLLEMTEESFDRVVAINTKGCMFMTQIVAKQMLKQEIKGRKRGTIINISSCSAVVTSTSRGEYCVSKAGISMLTKLYAERLAGEGIYVYEVRPGVIATDMTSGVKEKYDRLLEDGVFPIRRWGQPEDIGAVVSAFCSDQFLYSTGNYIDVDGGFHIQRL
jgi:3-oxoacyl-[acyl-carrier protein] reductase